MAKGRRPKTVPPSPLLLLIAFMEDDRKLSYSHPLLSVVAMKDDRKLSYRLSSSCRLSLGKTTENCSTASPPAVDSRPVTKRRSEDYRNLPSISIPLEVVGNLHA
ncbi:hypothetical protein Bbelb_117960 [Branchiostoma belcheri]|nr:hypothetical protein Bbelb_382030 [Branchiostoma belcheri]KAI8510880.1 hypothetical protein Bbelb_117960 [Branchiostoma belcheri]